MTEAQSASLTNVLVFLGILLAVATVVACKLKLGNHVQMEERRYRTTRRYAVVWTYLLMAGAILLFPLGMIGISAGDAGGWGCLLIALLFVVGSRLNFRVAKQRRPKWLEIALNRKQRENQRRE